MYSVKGADANPALPGTSQRPSPQQGRRASSDLIDFFVLPPSLVYVTDSSFDIVTTDTPAAILAIFLRAANE